MLAVSGNGGGPFRFEALDRAIRGLTPDPAVPVVIDLLAPVLSGFDAEPLGSDPHPEVAPSARVRDLELEDWAREIEGVCETVQGPLVLYGHGVGGAIVLEVLRHRRLPLDGVILHAPVGANLGLRLFPKLMKLPGVRPLARRMIASKMLRPVWRRRFFEREHPDAVVDRFFRGYRNCRAFSRLFDLITRDWFESLPASRVPARLLWGGRERLLEPAQARGFLRVLPTASIDVVEDWTHFPMIDDPERMAIVLREKVASLVRESSDGDRGADRPALPRLGDGALPRDAAPKAQALCSAHRAGLPVPDGFVLSDELWSEDAAWLRGALDLAVHDLSHRAGQGVEGLRFAVRSSFEGEDGAAAAGAGAFYSELGVTNDRLVEAIRRVRESGVNSLGRRDVLVQLQIDPERAGVAFTEAAFEDDLIESGVGLGDSVVREGGESSSLAKLRSFERRSGPKAEAGWSRRLQVLLLDVRRHFDDLDPEGLRLGSDLDVEWADDGERCWLLQCRPVTTPPRRDELFTVANHKEILPELPSVLMASVLEANASALYGHYRRFDASLPTSRPFLRNFHGRPRIDLSLLTDTVRAWGLPTRLVTDSIGGGTSIDQGPQPGRSLRKWRTLVRLGFAQFLSAPRSRKLRRRLRSPAQVETFGQFVEVFGRVYVDLVHGMMDLTGAMAPPLAMLRRFGWLEVLARSHRSVTSELFWSMEELRAAVPEDEALRTKLRAGEWPSGHPFEKVLEASMEKFGHRAIFESDIANPRTSDDPSAFLRTLAEPVTTSASRERAPTPTLRRLLAHTIGRPIWWAARGPLGAREKLRDQAMRGFARLRADLLRLAERAEEQQLLPSAEAVFDLEVEELRALDREEAFTSEHWQRRQEEIETRRGIELPDLFSSRDPLANREAPIPEGAIRGLGLVAGVVDGVVFRADSPAADWPNQDAPVVLVAPAVDAGWIPMLTRAAAVVVETGGDLSHGSIVLREVGVVSVTNARGAMRLPDGSAIRVDGAAGVVEAATGAGASAQPA